MSARGWIGIALCAMSGLARADERPAGPPPSMATVPVAELLRLHRESEAKPEEQPPPRPPLDATLERVSLDGRLLDDSVEIQATYRVTVLVEGSWVAVPLLTKGESTRIVELPALEHGVLAVRDGVVSLLTDRAGRHEFTLQIVERAARNGMARSATIRVPEATLAAMTVVADESELRLTSPSTRRAGSGVVVEPEDGAFPLRWERVTPVVKVEPEATSPPVEPRVVSGHASLVTTLEGRRILRILYRLQFSGAREIAIDLPPGSRLEKIYKNGVATALLGEGAELTVAMTPARAGHDEGTLELEVVENQGGFLLAGDLRFELPTLSWPMNELYLELHLPEVFEYTWTGGSLAPAGSSPVVAYAEELPSPGKRLDFHQYLIASSRPVATVHYAVDLAGKFFR